ncbi:Ethanolamine ammonia-lyase light chain [Neobacillus rhizosphaerae]|uniref:Ethanolamine ammonia-lyase small subunit n=1 Tax=Neobacillus rhizosphaerae TaxID=2880965 RepID=A0ABN8KK32_9BACI|nr:ethanolamine ammonia-lyase subunit EutC [Neobacillus rhizosphaerae]CAH2713806.1 Ethanolamine ammonia-lyase light chain [Neobacillus rhizosphaerae]
MDIQAIVKQVLEELKMAEHKNSSQLSTPNNKEKVEEIVRSLVFEKEKVVRVDSPIDRETIEKVQSITPARIGIGRTGTRMKTREYLDFRIDHAAAQDAVFRGVSEEFLTEVKLPVLQSKSESMDEYLMNLDSGRQLNEASRKWAEKNLSKNKQVQIIVSDGLSSSGIEANIRDLLPALIQGLQVKNISIGETVFIKRSRVWIQDEIASITNCDVVISLIGERPGLATSKSISAYLIYRPNQDTVEADRTVISNIHDGGIPPVEAGAYLADLLADVLQHKASGVILTQLKLN